MSKSTNKIQFHYLRSGFPFIGRTKCKAFIINLFKKEGASLEMLNYIFCDDEYLLNINRTFLNHDYFTDIISFNLAEKSEPVNGEIYISIDRIYENALIHGEPFYKELHRVLFHGALHLCGHLDKSPKDAKNMRFLEDKYLNNYFK